MQKTVQKAVLNRTFKVKTFCMAFKQVIIACTKLKQRYVSVLCCQSVKLNIKTFSAGRNKVPHRPAESLIGAVRAGEGRTLQQC